MADKSEFHCEISRLFIPNTLDYAPIVGIYAEAISRKFGFDAATSSSIALSLVDTMKISIKHSVEEHELTEVEMSFERTAEGIRITILEKGLPTIPEELDYASLCELVVADEGKEERFYCLNNFMDSFEFRNLGPKGKQTVLTKKIHAEGVSEIVDICSTGSLPRNHENTSSGKVSNIVIRRMREDEAIEVARAVYRTYGYSYGYEQVYFPERLANLNRNDEIITAVAVDESGAVVGTLSIMRWDENSTVAEIGQGVVIPSYRNSGIFSKLVDFQIENAISSGLKAFFAGLEICKNHCENLREGFHKISEKDG